jgi:hypothetical protein
MHQLPPPIDVTTVPNMWMLGASLICFVITPRVLSLCLYVNTGLTVCGFPPWLIGVGTPSPESVIVRG